MGFLDIIKNLFNNNKKTAKILTTDFQKTYGTTDAFKIILNDINDNPLPDKEIKIDINNILYTRKTNEEGVATLNINLLCGEYKATIEFKDDEYKQVRSYSKITVNPQIKTQDLKMTEKDGSKFKAHVVDANDNNLSNVKVIFDVNGAKYTRTSDNNGIASLNINLNEGDYKIITSSYGITVDNNIHISKGSEKHFGYWVFGKDMTKINIESLRRQGVTDIFLNYYAFKVHGGEKVTDWIQKAGNIKVHIWMQCFYDGEWNNPVNVDLNKIIEEAKIYASIDGVDGVHLDYLRYPGTAYKTPNGAETITNFVRNVKGALPHDIILSCAVMPENSAKHYYGQDIDALGEIVDVMIPMQYKGNYNAGDEWLASTTRDFSKKATIWSGLQSYKSDDDATLLSENEINNDIRICINNGAKGVLLFRYGMCPSINFQQFLGKVPTRMEGVNVNMTYKDGTQYQCAVYDANNARVFGNVDITVNGVKYTKIPTNEGLYKLNLNLNPGTYDVVSRFLGDENYLPSEVSNVIRINDVKNDTVPLKLYDYHTKQGGGYLGQKTGYSCGPHSLMQCIYRLTGIDVSESTLMSVCGTTSNGTGHSGLETGIAWFNRTYNQNIKIKWMNFSELGSDSNARFSKMQELINNGALFCHLLYRDKYGHYEVPKGVSGNNIVILNSLGEYCNYPAYCGYIENRSKNAQTSYINGISQKSIAYLYI